jgi:SWI/SNF-related matrix-associated actin-dependent regulator 1 of chromatin subfamily A
VSTLNLHDGRLILTCGPLDHDLARQIPGLAWHDDTGAWRGVPSWGTALAARGVFGQDLRLTPEVNEWGARQVAREQWAESLKNWTTDSAPWAKDLRPLQTTGVGFLTANQRAILADDPGAGKGVMVAVALGLLPDDAFPALIVCPKSVKLTHARLLEGWAQGTPPFVVSGTAKQRRDIIAEGLAHPRGVLVMNYEQVRAHSAHAGYGSVARTPAEKEPKELNSAFIPTVLLDEAHRVKDPKSKVTRAVRQVTSQAERVWATTATPIPDPIGYWSLLHTVIPWEAQSRTKYQDRYCLTQTVRAKGGREVTVVRDFNPRTQDELHRIVAPYFLRRTIDQIEPDLPPLYYKTQWVEMEGKQRTAYRTMQKDSLAVVGGDHIIAATDPMQRSLRLLQLASAVPVFEEYEVLTEGGPEVRQRLSEMIDPSCKIDAVLDWLDDTPGQQLVVFAASRRLIELLARRLEKAKHSHGLITGSQNEGQRGLVESEFQAGNLRVLAGTYGAMSEGITLTAASTQMMLQRSFKLIENTQADGRCRRIGQEASHVTIIDVVSANSYDEAVFRSGAYKEATAQALLRDPNWIARSLEAYHAP